MLKYSATEIERLERQITAFYARLARTNPGSEEYASIQDAIATRQALLAKVKEPDKWDSATIILCHHCGWSSKPLNPVAMSELGVPWYCDDCDKRVNQYRITLIPSKIKDQECQPIPSE